MPGYKIFFRVFLILIVVGGIATGIYFLVTLGGGRLSTFNLYNEIEDSEDSQLLEENMGEEDDFVGWAIGNDPLFSDVYSYYVSQKLVLDELSYNLYFADERAEGKSELETALYEYNTAMKSASVKVKLFIDRKAYFESASSIDGVNLSTDEIVELKEIVTLAREKILIQINEMNDLNGLLLPFVVQYSLGGNVSGSLKYSMLDAIYYQSDLLGNCLANTEITTDDLNDVVADTDRAVDMYAFQKASNFIAQGEEGSEEANFVLGYNSIEDSTKTGFFSAYDKEYYADAQSPAVSTNLYYVINFLNWWGVAK